MGIIYRIYLKKSIERCYHFVFFKDDKTEVMRDGEVDVMNQIM